MLQTQNINGGLRGIFEKREIGKGIFEKQKM